MNTPNPALNDPARCPLCGGDNRCAMELERATGTAQGPCWCVTEHFPPDLIAALPDEARGKACICTHCLRASARQHSTTGDRP